MGIVSNANQELRVSRSELSNFAECELYNLFNRAAAALLLRV